MLSGERDRAGELVRSRSIPTQDALPQVGIPRFARNDNDGNLLGELFGGKCERARLSRFSLLGANVVVLDHRIDHLIPSLNSTVRVLDRGIEARSFNQASQKRRFCDVQQIRLLMKIVLRGGLDASGIFTEPNPVRVDGQQVITREPPMQLSCCTPFLEMPLQHSGRLAEHHPRELCRHVRVTRSFPFSSIQRRTKVVSDGILRNRDDLGLETRI